VRAVLRLVGSVLVALLAGGCSSSDDTAPPADLFPALEQSWPDLGSTWPDFGSWPDLWAAPDGPQGSAASLFRVDVPGSACKNSWSATTKNVSGTSCGVHLEELQLGVGAGPEPDRYGCQVGSDGATVEATLYEIDCDDKAKISLSCAGSCDGQGVTRGSVTVPGSLCSAAWQKTGSNIGAGKTCVALVGEVKLGVGDGPEPAAFGCRYDASSGEVEAFIHELDCDDKAKIALRCDWICSSGSAAQSGTFGLAGSQCKTGWQTVSSAPGARCVTGITLMKLGVGSGPEPDRYGCRYDAATGELQAELFELDCDDQGVAVECAHLCLE
jgi:hypothetical protein